MEKWRRNFIIVAGFLEALFYSGCLFGKPSLLLILQNEGIYGSICGYGDMDTRSSFTDNMLSEIVPSILSSGEASTSYDSEFAELGLLNNEELGIEDLSNEIGKPNLNNMNHSQESQLLTSASVGPLDCNGSCDIVIETNLTNWTIVSCDEQRLHMTLIYTFAAVAYGITAVIIGISLEMLGIRTTRVVGSVFSCLGFLCLANIDPATSYLLWPSLNLIALGTNQLRLSGFLFADLWPEYRATIITAYSSAYAVSTTFFLGVQILYEWHVPLDLIFFLSAGGCVITLIPTLFMPASFVGVNSDSVKSNQNSVEDGDSTETPVDDKCEKVVFIKTSDENMEDGEHVKLGLESSSDRVEKQPTYWDSVSSISGLLHMYWHFINLFLVLFYSSTLNIWAAKVSTEHEDTSFYIKMSGVCCLVAPFLIPYAGVLTDRMIRRAEQIEDPVKSLAYKMQAPTFAMTAATILMALTMICKIFLNEIAIYTSLDLIALARPLVIGSCTSYIRLRFPGEHFNILNGVFTKIISVLCFVQYPIMKWMTSSSDSFVQVQVLLLALLLLSLTSPFHMMIRKNIMRYAERRLYGASQ